MTRTRIGATTDHPDGTGAFGRLGPRVQCTARAAFVLVMSGVAVACDPPAPDPSSQATPGAADPIAEPSLLAEQGIERLSTLLGDRFGGAELVVGPLGDTLRVSVLGPTPEDEAAIASAVDIPVEIVSDLLSDADLDAIASAVSDALASLVTDPTRAWQAGRVADEEVGVTIATLSDSERAAIVAAARDAAAARGLSADLGEAALSIEVDPTYSVPPTDLRETYPFYRAGMISTETWSWTRWCTTAFTVSVAGWGHFGTTAGHCAPVGSLLAIGTQTFTVSGSQYLEPGRTSVDAAAFPVGSNGRAELIAPDGTSVLPVYGMSKHYAIGSKVCKYGWKTAQVTGPERCGLITFRGVHKNFYGAVIKNMVCATIDSRHGDSGGPVYQRRGDGGVNAAGIHSAGSYVGMPIPDGSGFYTRDRACFSEIGAINAALGTTLLTQPPPDGDADGVADVDDPCQTTAGGVTGCRPNPPPTMQGDMTGDGRPDLFAFYKYNNNTTGLWMWDGADLSGEPRKLWQSGKWNTDKVIPAGVGDVDGDGKVELFAFFRYAGNVTALWMWRGAELAATPTKMWESGGWDGTRVIPAGAADVDADGKAEVFTFYRYDGKTGLFRWWGAELAGGTQLSPSSAKKVWQQSWDATRVIPGGLGDTDADGKADLFAFYRYDGNETGLWRWPGSSLAVATSASHAATNKVWQGGGWNGNRVMPAGVGDVTGDGRADVLTFFRYESDRTKLFVFPGDDLDSPDQTWESADGAWPGRRHVPVGLANLVGSSRLDVAVFTRNLTRLRINVFTGIGPGTFAAPTVSVWDTPASNFVPERTLPL